MAGMPEKKIMTTRELFQTSLHEYHKGFIKPLSRRRMDSYFSDEVLVTARKVIVELKPKALEELKSEVEEKLVKTHRVLEMIDAKEAMVADNRPLGPAWRFSGEPQEDARSVQWMVCQEMKKDKLKQLKRIQAHNEELQENLDRKMALLSQLQATQELSFQSLADTSDVASTTLELLQES